MRAELNDLRESEADLKRTELKKIAELKDSLLDTRRRIGSENIFVTRFKYFSIWLGKDNFNNKGRLSIIFFFWGGGGG